MSSIKDLEILLGLIATAETKSEMVEIGVEEEARLRVELEKNRERLERVLDYPGPNASERKALEEGIFRPGDGKPAVRINNEFRTEVHKLADELKLSENLCAAYLCAAFEEHDHGRTPAGHTVSETAAMLYRRERALVLAVLDRILASSVPVLGQYAEAILKTNIGGRSWTERVVDNIVN